MSISKPISEQNRKVQSRYALVYNFLKHFAGSVIQQNALKSYWARIFPAQADPACLESALA